MTIGKVRQSAVNAITEMMIHRTFKPLSCWEAIEEAPSQSTLLSNLDLEPIQLLTFLWSVTCSSFQTNDTKAKYIEDKNFCCKYLKWQTGSEKSSHPIQVISYPSNSFSDLCFKHLANFAVHNVHFIQRQYQTSWYRKCKDKYKYSNVWNKLILHGTLFTSKYDQKYEYASIMSFIFTNQALRHGLPVSLSLYIKAY